MDEDQPSKLDIMDQSSPNLDMVMLDPDLNSNLPGQSPSTTPGPPATLLPDLLSPISTPKRYLDQDDSDCYPQAPPWLDKFLQDMEDQDLPPPTSFPPLNTGAITW